MWTNPLGQTEHRPWPLPSGRPVMRMTWSDLLFAHWPVDPGVVRAKLPASLELETFDGAAWIGVVPFAMRNVGLHGLPSPPWLSSFLELNVRTYVRAGPYPGVWFFSLDAANPAIVRIARRWYHLPYFHARMTLQTEGDRVHYASARNHRGFPGGDFRAHYRPTGEIARAAPGSFDSWLTERYCLYAADRHGQLRRGHIHHLPWPLQPAEVDIAVNTVTEAHGLDLPGIPPVLHFSRNLDVLAWNPVLVR